MEHAPSQPLMRPLLSQFQTPTASREGCRFFRVWLPGELPRRADHPAYFGLATDYEANPFSRRRWPTYSRGTRVSMPIFGATVEIPQPPTTTTLRGHSITKPCFTPVEPHLHLCVAVFSRPRIHLSPKEIEMLIQCVLPCNLVSLSGRTEAAKTARKADRAPTGKTRR